jgi:hypothetical protein
MVSLKMERCNAGMLVLGVLEELARPWVQYEGGERRRKENFGTHWQNLQSGYLQCGECTEYIRNERKKDWNF